MRLIMNIVCLSVVALFVVGCGAVNPTKNHLADSEELAKAVSVRELPFALRLEKALNSHDLTFVIRHFYAPVLKQKLLAKASTKLSHIPSMMNQFTLALRHNELTHKRFSLAMSDDIQWQYLRTQEQPDGDLKSIYQFTTNDGEGHHVFIHRVVDGKRVIVEWINYGTGTTLTEIAYVEVLSSINRKLDQSFFAINLALGKRDVSTALSIYAQQPKEIKELRLLMAGVLLVALEHEQKISDPVVIQILKIYANSGHYSDLLLGYYMALEDYENALLIVNSLITELGRDGVYIASKGVILSLTGDYDGAIALFKKAIYSDPEHMGVYQALMGAFVRHGKFDGAVLVADVLVKKYDYKFSKQVLRELKESDSTYIEFFKSQEYLTWQGKS